MLHSFTEGTGCKHPFMFTTKGGVLPKLKATRRNSVVKSGSKRGKGGRVAGVRSRTGKASSKQKSKAEVEDSEPEAELTDYDGSTVNQAVTASKEEAPAPKRRPKPRPAVKKPEARVTAYSMTLQLPEMESGSTLIPSWKVRSYEWKKVSFGSI